MPPYRAITAWVLIAQILLQPLLAYWVTPHATQGADGQWVVICTLNGNQAVYLDFGADPDSAADDEYCPALQLYQLAGSAQPARPLQIAAPVAYRIGPVDQSGHHQHPAHPELGFSPRAPPIV